MLYTKTPTLLTKLKFIAYFWLPGIVLFFTPYFYDSGINTVLRIIGISWIAIGAFWSAKFGEKRNKLFCYKQGEYIIVKPGDWINSLKLEIVKISETTISRRKMHGLEASIYLTDGYCYRFIIEEKIIFQFSEFMLQLAPNISVNNYIQHNRVGKLSPLSTQN